VANRIVDVGMMHLVGLTGEFLPESLSTEIPALWGKFVPRIREIKNRKKGWVKFGACRATPDKKLEYAAAIEVDRPEPATDGLAAITVAPGPYALFNHHGHIRDIGKTWNAIREAWMKEEGYVHRDGAYDFERYDERWNPETGEGIVDIYLAIEHARA
jgi:AraC family transcriptional regulator